MDRQEGIRNFGFDIPASEQNKNQELRGYEYWVIDLLQITTTKENSLNEENFNPDTQKDIYQGNSQHYNNTYYNYPNNQAPDMKIKYSNLDSKLFNIELFGMPTNRGLKVGDPGSKVLELYGYQTIINPFVTIKLHFY